MGFILGFGNVINISNSSMVHIGSNIVVNPVTSSEKSANKTAKQTDLIKKLFNSSMHMQHGHISFVAKHIDKNWKNVGRALGYSEGQITQFELNHNQLGVEEVYIFYLINFVLFLRLPIIFT